jgi:hypothetical protein
MRPDPSVMASKAPRVVEADDASQQLHRRLNYFPTPPWAARAGGELITRLDPGAWHCWEPAAGGGHMAAALWDYFPILRVTDIHDHDRPRGAPWSGRLDFLSADADGLDPVDWIVTNPPFETAGRFVELGLARARRGVAMLCRLNWIESAGRYPLFFGAHPLSVFAPFAERVPMVLGRWDPSAGSATGYAWFVWMHPPALVAAAQRCVAITAATPVILPIGPGTRARLTKPDDARRFGARAAAPLFEGLDGDAECGAGGKPADGVPESIALGDGGERG